MRSTLQTVPESLPADHITNSSGTTATTTASTETPTTTKSSHSHTNASLKGRTTSSKVSATFYHFRLSSIFFFFSLFTKLNPRTNLIHCLFNFRETSTKGVVLDQTSDCQFHLCPWAATKKQCFFY